jgi:hypothetical protein
MRNTVIWSFLSLAALAAGGLVAGCNGDVKITKSSDGESCTKTSDCNDGLKCVQGTCYKIGGGTKNPGAGGDNGGAGTPGVIGPPPPVLGGPGESCTKRADCEDGLGCFNQRCQMDNAGQGGGGTVGPALGTIGETCGVNADCGTGLVCKSGVGESSFGVGVCTPIDSGLKPTGKDCGHECLTAADCCELPIAEQTTTGASSCSDLVALVGNIPNCDIATGMNGAICLAYNSYCDGQCGKTTWSCDAGACTYTATCTKATPVVGGCPAYTRGGTPIPSCDIKAGKCELPPADVVGCAKDSECDAGLVVADHPTDKCSKGECICHKASGGCFRKCGKDLDCASGYNCDKKSSLCVPIAGCTTDIECAQRLGDIRAKCNTAGACERSCEHDLDCNFGGLIDGSFRLVCSPDKTCVALGCSSDEECAGSPLAGGVHSFCAPRVAPPTVTLPVSAITD